MSPSEPSPIEFTILGRVLVACIAISAVMGTIKLGMVLFT
jgi:hypothetical protein